MIGAEYDLALVNIGLCSETRSYGKVLLEPSAGIHLLASICRQRGFRVRVLDGLVEPITVAIILDVAKRSSAVGFYAVHSQMSQIGKAARIIKECSPETLVLVGGPNSVAAEEILEKEGSVDAVLKDPAFMGLLEIIEAKRNGKIVLSGIRGIFTRLDGDVIETTNSTARLWTGRALTIPFQLKDSSTEVVKILSAVGCPNRCAFCSSRPWAEFCNVGSLIEEVRNAVTAGASTIYVGDESFVSPALTRRAWTFCEGVETVMKGREIKLKIYLEPSASQELVARLASIFKITAFVGFESFNDKTLKFLGKKTTREQNLRFWDFLKENHVNVIPGIIPLHPNVTPEEIEDLLSLLDSYGKLSWRLLAKKLELCPGSRLLDSVFKRRPELLKAEFSPVYRPDAWQYEYDLMVGDRVMARIENAFKQFASKNNFDPFQQDMDISFFGSLLSPSERDCYNYCVEMFGLEIRRIATLIIRMAQTDSNDTYKQGLSRLRSEYSRKTREIRHQISKLCSSLECRQQRGH